MTKNEFLSNVNAAAEPYGYAVDESGRIISPSGKQLAIEVTKAPKGSRLHICTASGNLLFSGSAPTSIAAFLESFFYAEKIAA